jgi:hypothetical protein
VMRSSLCHIDIHAGDEVHPSNLVHRDDSDVATACSARRARAAAGTSQGLSRG